MTIVLQISGKVREQFDVSTWPLKRTAEAEIMAKEERDEETP